MCIKSCLFSLFGVCSHYGNKCEYHSSEPVMKLLGLKTLKEFKERHADAKSQIESWEAEVQDAQWATPHDLKRRYPKASLVKDKVIFDICGNKYRLLTKVNYQYKMVLVEKVGNHKEYDGWDITG